MEKDFYNYISSYFEHPSMEKISTNEEYDIYATNIPCYLFQEYKYLMCHVPVNPRTYIGSVEQLSNLEWDMFETVILHKKIPCVENYYHLDKQFPRIRLKLLSNEGKHTTFKCDFPFHVILENPVENVSPYGEYGNLVSALEVYHTKILRI
jgi:hypothetical protein